MSVPARTQLGANEIVWAMACFGVFLAVGDNAPAADDASVAQCPAVPQKKQMLIRIQLYSGDIRLAM